MSKIERFVSFAQLFEIVYLKLDNISLVFNDTKSYKRFYVYLSRSVKNGLHDCSVFRSIHIKF